MPRFPISEKVEKGNLPAFPHPQPDRPEGEERKRRDLKIRQKVFWKFRDSFPSIRPIYIYIFVFFGLKRDFGSSTVNYGRRRWVVEGESDERYAFLLPVLADSISCPTDGQPPHHDQTGRRVCVPTRWPYATYAPDSLGFFYAQVGRGPRASVGNFFYLQ